MQSHKIHSSGVILIGGKSTRFGNDKAFIMINGNSLSLQLYNLLNDTFTNAFFVSDRQNKINIKNAKLYTDVIPDKGPLGGIYTALKYSKEEYCFITACDLPFIETKLINVLWENRGNADIIIPRWNNKSEPLAAFYHKNCLKSIEKEILLNRLAVQNLWKDVSVKSIDCTSIYSNKELEKIFFNINTLEDYQNAKNKIY